MTNRDVVSQVRSMNKLFGEATINDRTILRECKNVANLLVHQDLDKRKLWQSPNLFAYLPCVPMEEVSLSECCEFESDCTIAKSSVILPKIGEGIWGLAIQGVFGLDGRVKFKETNPNRFANTLKLKLNNVNIFYWIRNDRIYVTNPDTKYLDMFLYPTEDVPNELLFPGEHCSCRKKPDIDSLCASYLDKKFYFPDHRVADMFRIVEQNLLQAYFNVAADKTSNNQDEQSK